jgi:WD40 repeat protein
MVLGLENGQLQVYNDQGVLIMDRQILQVPLQRVAFSSLEYNWTLAVVSSHNQILLLNSAYEVELRSWQSSDPIRMIQWSNDGKMLAVVCSTGNIIILNNEARVVHSFTPPLVINEDSTISFTWAHNDEVIIVSSNGGLAVGIVQPSVPALTDISSYQIWRNMGRTAREVESLNLPDKPTNIIRQFDRHVIKCRIPSYERMCRFVCEPTFWRWYCTIVPVPRKTFHYMLCIEHLGGLIPILLGRQINRVIPQFIISLPPPTGFLRGRFAISSHEHRIGKRRDFASNGNPNWPVRSLTNTPDSESTSPLSLEDSSEMGYTSTVATERKLNFNRNVVNFIFLVNNIDDDIGLLPSFNSTQPRNTVWRRSKRRIKKFVSKRLSPRAPKANRMLCHVRSNVWCTRFKISSPGIKDLPMTLAQVVYKTSVLHLQPRQMTINLCDLRPLTKTMIDPGVNGSNVFIPLQSAMTHKKYRSVS